MIRFHSARHPRFIVVTALLVSFGLLGCGGSKDAKTGTVKGTVTVDGKPANAGTVGFKGSDGLTVSGSIQKDGTYQAVNVPAGEVQVTVTGPTGAAAKTLPDPTGGDTGGGTPIPIPPNYAKTETSNLKTTVKGGTTNTYDIPLTK